MTTEDDFQNELDANPNDWQTRLVFADFLEERGDPRAEGYRALGKMRKTPEYVNGEHRRWWYCVLAKEHPENVLEGEWWQFWKEAIGYDRTVFCLDTRREAEDAAAIAFAKLPAERRAELLSTVPL